MYRIKDPKRSLDFYTRIIGMRCVSLCMHPICVTHALHTRPTLPSSIIIEYHYQQPMMAVQANLQAGLS